MLARIREQGKNARDNECRSRVEIIDGALLDADWIRDRAAALLKTREAERARQRDEAREAAAQRRTEMAQQGLDPEASFIEAIAAGWISGPSC